VTVQAMPSAVALLDPAKIVDLLGRSLRCYERYFGVPYPYRKCDLVFVPGLAELAYSVPGLIVINDQVLHDPAARADRYLAALLAHELAHEWFGGVVSMRRHAERSLDEALTTYVSRMALAEVLPGTDPWEARTSESLPDYAYTRDAAAYRELEALIGRPAVIAGLSDLLRRHTYGHPSHEDLVRYWTRASGRELSEWAARTLVLAGES
jgi:aminopeptidase N